MYFSNLSISSVKWYWQFFLTMHKILWYAQSFEINTIE